MWRDADRALESAGIHDPEERGAYLRALAASLEDTWVEHCLGKRPGAYEENVRTAMRRPENVERVRNTGTYSDACGAYESARTARDAAVDRLASLRPRAAWNALLVVVFSFILVLCALPAAVGMSWWPWGACLLMAVLAGTFLHADSRVRLGYGLLVLVVVAEGVFWNRQMRQRIADLERSLADDIMPGEVKRVVRDFLGEDPDCLLLETEYEGLRVPRHRGYVVSNHATEEIQHRLDALVDGTIAVSGPRGSGKTTLLETCGRPGDLRVAVQAPASYSPLEFLTSLYVDVCESYMMKEGYHFPEFRRLSPLRVWLRRLATAVRRNAWQIVAGFLALALITLGTLAAAHGLAEGHGEGFVNAVRGWADGVRGFSAAVLDGRRPWVAAAFAVIGCLVWEYVRWWRITGYVLVARLALVPPLGNAIAAVALITVWSPRPVIDWIGRWRLEDPWAFYLGTVFVGLPLLAAAVSLGVGVLWDELDGLIDFVSTGVFAALFIWALADERVRNTAYGWDISQRVALVVLGIALARAAYWTRRPREPALVTRCRDQLFRLQTVQSVSYGATGAPGAGLLSVGSSYGTSFTASPVTLPELVQQLRGTLAEVAEDRARHGERVIVTIDEIDRLGSTAKALEFLGEIKAVLGVPGVHFLISVSEDVGASFVRRGLSGRDVVDSTFDDVIHVRPCVLKESERILCRRIKVIPPPFVALVHALAGGVPRDLIRYSRELMVVQKTRNEHELQRISAWLVTREIRETVNGLRSVLRESALPTGRCEAVFTATRRLVETLESDRLHKLEAMKEQIAWFAMWAERPESADWCTDLPADAVERLHEAAAYAYFCVTLLDVFARPGFDRRRASAREAGPDGRLERLAEARVELSYSPTGARRLISGIRTAWRLPVVPDGQGVGEAARPDRPRGLL